MTFSRRHFCLATLAVPAFAAKPAGEQPNIVLIAADGVGAWLLGCYGNKEVRTPNIDRLAKTGTRFLNHYAGAPVASAGRESLLGGVEKLLTGAGYSVQTVSGAPGAAQYLDMPASGKPWLLIANFSPYQAAAEPKYLAPYAQSKFDTWAQEPPAKNAARNQEMMGRNLLANLRNVAAQTAAFDDQVGAIANAIERKKLGDRTLIVFTATCGSLFGAHGLWGDGEASNPINMYEEVVNTPMIWKWPGRVPPLAVRPEMVSASDLAPTLAVLTGAEMAARDLTGRSYMSLASGIPLPKKQPWKTTVLARYRNTAMARVDRYKLVVRDEGKGPGELYDDKQDPKERTNQYDNPQFLTVRSSLMAELRK